MARKYKYSRSCFLPEHVEDHMLRMVSAHIPEAFCDPVVHPFPVTLEELRELVWHPDAIGAHDMVAQYVAFPALQAHPFTFHVVRDGWSGVRADYRREEGPLVATVSESAMEGKHMPLFPAKCHINLCTPVWGGASASALAIQEKVREWAAFIAECEYAKWVAIAVLNNLLKDCTDLKQMRALLPTVSILLDDGNAGSAGSKLAEQARTYKAPAGLPAINYKADLTAVSGWIAQGSMLLAAKASGSRPKPGTLKVHF
jgi:hypothetical protein